MNLTLAEDDIRLGTGYEGFTCRGGGQTNDNWYNFTEALGGGGSSGGDGEGAGNKNSGAGVLGVGYGVGTALLAVAVMFSL